VDGPAVLFKGFDGKYDGMGKPVVFIMELDV